MKIKNILDNTIKNSDYRNIKNKKIKLHSNPVNKREINFPVLKKTDIEELIKIGIGMQ